MPAAGYPFHRAARARASTAATRCRRRARCVLAARRDAAGARGCCAGSAPTPCSAAAATSPGPVGLAAALTLRLPLVLTEADSHLGIANRLLAPLAQRVFLAFPIDGPRRRGATWSPGGRSRRGTGTRRPRGRARALRDRRRTSRACSCSAARSARAGSTTRRSRRSARRRPAPCCTPAGRRDYDELRAPPRRARLAAALPPLRLHRAVRRRARGRRPGRGARRRLGVRAGGRRPARACSCPTRTRPPTTRPPTPAGWREAGAAVVVPDAELDGPRLAREVGSAARRAAAAGGDGQGGARGRAARRGRADRRRAAGAGDAALRSPPSSAASHVSGRSARGDAAAMAALGPAAPALRRHRRRGHERPGARRARARRRGDRLRPAESPYCERCARPASSPSSATTRRTCPTAPRWSSRRRSRRTTPSWQRRARPARRCSTAATCSASSSR